MACPVCFAYAGATNYVYEPSYEQIVEMIKLLRANSPWACNALQFSGGEPTIRNDLPDLIKEAKKAGIEHIEVNTNGLRIAEDINYFKKLLDAGTSTLYLQFDGLREEIYKKTRARTDLVPIKHRVIENARKLGLESIVLVVTLAKSINDKDQGRHNPVRHKKPRCCPLHQRSTHIHGWKSQKKEMRKMRITMVKSGLIRGLLKDVITKGSYEALGKFMRRIVMIGIMHFQDVWNFDLDRVQKCAIHYATPDMKIRPSAPTTASTETMWKKNLPYP